MQMCDQQIRVQHRCTDGDETEGVKEVKRIWQKWVLAMNKHNANTESRGIDSRVQIERAAFPSFEGSHESWPEFKRLFEVLMKGSRQNRARKLVQLRAKMRAHNLELKAGTTEHEEAWTLLDKQYGDRNYTQGGDIKAKGLTTTKLKQ